MFELGSILPNGAVVIEHDPQAGVVLARFRNAEYVTWRIGEDGDTYWGHYFGGDLGAAMADFRGRVNVARVEVLDGRYIAAVPQLG